MIREMANIEANIPAFDNALKKLKSCKHYVEFMGQKSCNIFHHRFDGSMGILSICGSCKANTKKPTTSNIKVRFY